MFNGKITDKKATHTHTVLTIPTNQNTQLAKEKWNAPLVSHYCCRPKTYTLTTESNSGIEIQMHGAAHTEIRMIIIWLCELATHLHRTILMNISCANGYRDYDYYYKRTIFSRLRCHFGKLNMKRRGFNPLRCWLDTYHYSHIIQLEIVFYRFWWEFAREFVDFLWKNGLFCELEMYSWILLFKSGVVVDEKNHQTGLNVLIVSKLHGVTWRWWWRWRWSRCLFDNVARHFYEHLSLSLALIYIFTAFNWFNATFLFTFFKVMFNTLGICVPLTFQRKVACKWPSYTYGVRDARCIEKLHTQTAIFCVKLPANWEYQWT